MFSFTDTGKLRQVALALQNMPRAVREDAARRLEPRYRALLDLNFRRRADPYGAPWPAPRAGNPPMERSGAGRRGYEVRGVSAGAGISMYVANARSYMAFWQKHQQAPRIQAPVQGRALPYEWQQAHALSYREACEAYWASQGK